MRICVIGGAGYIGSLLAPALGIRGHEVTVVDLFWFGDHLPQSVIRKKMDASLLEAKDLQGFDAVVFLAGLSNDPMADFQPYKNFEFNAALPAYLADQALKAGVKVFVHGGSCSVYGRIEEIATERKTPMTVTPYGLSKLLGEHACLQYGREGSMRVVAFRMGTVCGFSPRMRFDLVINAMVKDGITKGVLSVNDPEARRPILDIRDAVGAYIQAICDSRITGAVNLASFNISVGEIAETVSRVLREERGVHVRVEDKGIPDKRSYTVDLKKAQQLGIYPTASCEYTVSRVVRAFDAKLEAAAENDEYYNIRMFKKMFATAWIRPRDSSMVTVDLAAIPEPLPAG